LFTVPLGDATLVNMTALGATLFQQTKLQLRLWFNNGVNGFAALSPLQNLTAAPYANYAYAATTLTTGTNQPLNFSINGNNVLRITAVHDFPSSSFTANSVGGSSANVIGNGVVGGFIGGGGSATSPNRVGGNYASVLGVWGNIASGPYSTAMGYYSTASGDSSIAMGLYAHAVHDRTFIWSAYLNSAPTFSADTFCVSAPNGIGINYGAQRGDGGGQYWLNLGTPHRQRHHRNFRGRAPHHGRCLGE
jgi:hypothetical protein